jgi:hypothetical protein
MLVEYSTACQCRYGDFVKELYGDWEVVVDLSEDDYSGNVDLVATKDGKYLYLQYYYGSCSVCDTWEGDELSGLEIEDEIRECTLFFDNKEQYNEWLERTAKLENR